MTALLPANLPDIRHAKLPATYEAARRAIAECCRIDECKDWADKAEALASYARQAKDDELRKMADRIQARAIRRCGELLQAFKNERARTDLHEGTHTQTKAARAAGLSEYQKVTAVRIANIPEDEFEAAVASDNPPTVTALAERGKKPAPKPLIDIGERDPQEFSLATSAQGELRRFAEFCESADADAVVRGSFPREFEDMREHATTIMSWLTWLLDALEDQECTAKAN